MTKQEIMTKSVIKEIVKLHTQLHEKLMTLFQDLEVHCPNESLQGVRLALFNAVRDIPILNPAYMGPMRPSVPDELRRLAFLVFNETEQTHLIPYVTDEEAIKLALDGANPAEVGRQRWADEQFQIRREKAEAQARLEAEQGSDMTRDEIESHARMVRMGVNPSQGKPGTLSRHLGLY